MKAGQELDLLIASEVMCEEMPGDYEQAQDGRWMKEEPIFDSDGTYSRAYYLVEWPPHYSTDIAAAWQVVEKLVETGHCPGLLFDDDGRWALSLEGMQNCPPGGEPFDVCTSFYVEAGMWYDTAPLAICLAALKAVRSNDESRTGTRLTNS